MIMPGWMILGGMKRPRPALVHPRGITPTSPAAVLRRRAGFRRLLSWSRGLGGVIIAGGVIMAVALVRWGRSCRSRYLRPSEVRPPPPGLVQDSIYDDDDGDYGVAMTKKGALFGDGHNINRSVLPVEWTGGEVGATTKKGAMFGDGHRPNVSVLPVEWTGGETDRCHPRSKIHPWKKWGWGSNINRLVFTWANEIYKGRTDVALDFTGTIRDGLGLDGVECYPGADEAEQRLLGWNCLFKPMRHLCIFHHDQELQQFVAAKQNLKLQSNASHPQLLSLNVSDKVAVPAALIDFLYSNLQPWFEADIRTILEEDELLPVRDAKYVALHVRRGDKLKEEAIKVEVEDYVKAAASAIGRATAGHSGIESITGLWVSSDDATVLPEVRELTAGFFPHVRRENVVSISFRSVDNNTEIIPTTTTKMTYDRYVLLHTELAIMAAADVFVGTFSSNIGRLVYLIREGHGFARNSTISVDDPNWYMGRRSRA